MTMALRMGRVKMMTLLCTEDIQLGRLAPFSISQASWLHFNGFCFFFWAASSGFMEDSSQIRIEVPSQPRRTSLQVGLRRISSSICAL
jgi:hypothetical protein